MLISRFVRTQLAIFGALTLVATLLIVFVYLQIPSLLGVGRIEVTAHFSAAGGLYPNANVTYQGYTIGRVTRVDLAPDGVAATLSIEKNLAPPEGSKAQVQSVGAIGEQYVDLMPTATASSTPMRGGDVIPESRTSVPIPTATVLDDTASLVNSISDPNLSLVLDEASKAFNGLGPALGQLADNTRLLVQAANENYQPTTHLINGAAPFLDTQLAVAPALRSWTGDLAGFTQELVNSDPKLRRMLSDAPPAAHRAGDLLQELSTTVPTLLDSTQTLAELAKEYHKPIQQVLVIYPIAIMAGQSIQPKDNPGIFKFNLETQENPPSCFTGYEPEGTPGGPRPSSQWGDEQLPANSFCHAPQDSPIMARSARLLPCFEPGSPPGRRAPTIQECRGSGYEPQGRQVTLLTPGAGFGNLAIPSSVPDPLSAIGGVGDSPPTAKELTWQGFLLAPTSK
jgi:phospholipid/cholesterol/gamma-HCH transport system substrate-binding protein